jgi:hypothetical protein
MGWGSVLVTGLVVRRSMRRSQQRRDELEAARLRDLLARQQAEAERDGITIWPPEQADER